MQLSDICVSLELAKQLKEAGYDDGQSLFYYMRAEDKYTKYTPYGKLRYGLSGYYGLNTEGYVLGMAGLVGLANCKEYFSAPTASELGEQLPKMFTENPGQDNNRWFPMFYPLNDEDWTAIWHMSGEEMVVYPKNVPGLPEQRSVSFRAKSEADSRALLWLYLKHQGLLSTKEEE